jgi:hypothetical protein
MGIEAKRRKRHVAAAYRLADSLVSSLASPLTLPARRAEILTAFYELAGITGVYLDQPSVARSALLEMITVYRDEDAAGACELDLMQHLSARRALERLREVLDCSSSADPMAERGKVVDINLWRLRRSRLEPAQRPMRRRTR